MSGSYEHLRESLNAGKGMDMLFTRLALSGDGTTAALVALAAVNVPVDRVAALVGRDVDEVDALVSLFNASMRRSIASEREARGAS